jgi:hypothetical protein
MKKGEIRTRVDDMLRKVKSVQFFEASTITLTKREVLVLCLAVESMADWIDKRREQEWRDDTWGARFIRFMEVCAIFAWGYTICWMQK